MFLQALTHTLNFMHVRNQVVSNAHKHTVNSGARRFTGAALDGKGLLIAGIIYVYLVQLTSKGCQAHKVKYGRVRVHRE